MKLLTGKVNQTSSFIDLKAKAKKDLLTLVMYVILSTSLFEMFAITARAIQDEYLKLCSESELLLCPIYWNVLKDSKFSCKFGEIYPLSAHRIINCFYSNISGKSVPIKLATLDKVHCIQAMGYLETVSSHQYSHQETSDESFVNNK